MDDKILVTCECAPNIALVKYWGKKNEDLIIPLNSSLSVTLDKNVLKTKTSVLLIKKKESFKEKDIKIWFDKNLIEFNELDEKVKNSELINTKRFLRVLHKIRSNCKIENVGSYAIRIYTYNTFPTACGLASSASGNACMALALSHAFGYKDDVTELARLGSGSACRSCYGGFVKWCGNDDPSLAIQLFKSNHWQEINILILVLNDQKKEVSSTNGMKVSTQTSELLKERVKIVDSTRIPMVEEAIRVKNFQKLAELIMRESNQFHAVCLDSYPPLFYLNQKSQEIINFINAFNSYHVGEIKAAYSFDAGPNAFIFIQDEYLSEFVQLLRFFYFDQFSNEIFLKEKLTSYLDFDEKSSLLEEVTDINEKKLKYFNTFNFNPSKSNDFIKFIMHSKIGDEPTCIIDDKNFEHSLLNSNGEPKGQYSSNPKLSSFFVKII
jgi:diphosphomevalonate decarboxylase